MHSHNHDDSDLLNHYQSILQSDISGLCAPLELLNIHFFHFMRVYNDRSRLHLSNRPEWVEHYYKQRFYCTGSLSGPIELYQSCVFLWETLENQIIFQEANEYFNIAHGITMVRKFPKWLELVHFGSSRGNVSIKNSYFQHMDLLRKFILYFKEAASDLIKCAEKNRIVVPGYNLSVDQNDLAILNKSVIIQPTDIKDQFKQATKIKKFNLTIGNRQTFLSHRELTCLMYLISGKTATQTAEKLFLSKRTVETHINNIKNKFGCSLRSELIDQLVKMGLDIEALMWIIFE